MKSQDDNLGSILRGSKSKLSSISKIPIIFMLLAVMTYNQIQSFQINDCANHYVGIKIRVLYGEIIAGRGVARLISWLGTAGPVDCFKSVFDC